MIVGLNAVTGDKRKEKKLDEGKKKKARVPAGTPRREGGNPGGKLTLVPSK